MAKRPRPTPVHEPGDGKFSHWVQPTNQKRHYIECCDCALTHEFQFRTVIGPHGKALTEYRVKRVPTYKPTKR